MKLARENPHIKLGTMRKLKKADILTLIHSEDILKAGMALRKDTIVDWLNYELNQTMADIIDFKEVGE